MFDCWTLTSVQNGRLVKEKIETISQYWWDRKRVVSVSNFMKLEITIEITRIGT